MRSERDSQSSVGGREEVDRLVSEVSALSLEREQLQALLEALREEMVQLREKLEDKTRMVPLHSEHAMFFFCLIPIPT